jgi:hypothetical protein
MFLFLRNFLPHPEERRLRRVSKDESRVSWFEAAQAPPHHEGRQLQISLSGLLNNVILGSKGA